MKKTIRKTLALLLITMPLTAHAVPVDLSGWITLSPPDQANWQVLPGNDSVVQTINGNPTTFFDPNDFDSHGEAIAGQIQVNTTEDDDYIGFILGTGSSTGEFYIIDWKQETQVTGPPGCGTAQAGLAFSVFPNANDFCDFWDHDGVEVERASTLGSTGWEDGVAYDFSIIYGADLIQVIVDDVVELSITAAEAGLSEFQNGGFGFYNFSQEQVLYSAITTADCDANPTAPECMVPVTEPATLWLLLLGGFGFRMRRQNRS